MLISTTETIPGYAGYTILGEVFGVTTQSRSGMVNFGASLKSMFGGEIKSYTHMLERSRQKAIQRMCDNAENLGANAVIMMRFDSGSISNNMQSVVAYGTAVVIKK